MEKYHGSQMASIQGHWMVCNGMQQATLHGVFFFAFIMYMRAKGMHVIWIACKEEVIVCLMKMHFKLVQLQLKKGDKIDLENVKCYKLSIFVSLLLGSTFVTTGIYNSKISMQ